MVCGASTATRWSRQEWAEHIPPLGDQSCMASDTSILTVEVGPASCARLTSLNSATPWPPPIIPPLREKRSLALRWRLATLRSSRWLFEGVSRALCHLSHPDA